MPGGVLRIGFAAPGDPDQRTGGFGYNRRVCERLQRAVDGPGHSVIPVRLADAFPSPDCEALAHARDALAGVDCDVLVIDGLAFGALPGDILGKISVPIVALVHHPLALESGLAAGDAARLRESETAALAFARQVVVTSSLTRDTLVRDYGVEAERITVAVPGVELAASGELADVARASPPLILSVGSLTVRKGHDVLLAALARIADLDWQCRIVGGAQYDPETAQALVRQVARCSLATRVTFAGEVGCDALARHYREAHVFALATRYEGYGMVFSEAIAHGLPIVACAGGATVATVPEAAGVLVDVDDDAALADALGRVLSEPGLHRELSAGARRAAADLPSWDDAVKHVEGAIKRAAGG